MITLQEIVNLLIKEDLLRELVIDGNWYYNFPKEVKDIKFTNLTYFSKEATAESLFFCKGLNFKREYLEDAIKHGAKVYMAENLDEKIQELAVIVTDIQKAMAVVARAFFGYPDKEITTIGITGTKGKTTVAYMIRHILAEATSNKVAQLSSSFNILDGKTEEPAKLTTPEALDLFRMMRTAVDNNMKYFVMEVSSQAYKRNRVYGLIFDYSIFLNISLDHISPIEHPTFDDYFGCKLELLKNTKQLILNANSKYADFILERAKNLNLPCLTYGEEGTTADYTYYSQIFDFTVKNTNSNVKSINSRFNLSMPGDFNQSNAVSAIILGLLCNVDIEKIQVGLQKTVVPGRMEKIQGSDGKTVYVDYAHNYLSLKKALQFLKEAHPEAKIITITGSIGGKALNRRYDLGRAMSEETNIAIITSEDSKDENPEDIASQIRAGITNYDVKIYEILDREEAIKEAIAMAETKDIVFIAGKGRENFLDIKGETISYPGDHKVAKKYLK